MSNELIYLSASDAIRRFRAGTLSPVTLMDAVLAAADRQQSTVNATTAIFAEAARAQAKAAEQRYRDGTARPLEGVPVVVKEETDVAGWRNTVGSLLFENAVAKENHPIIDKLLDAGAILHVQATNPEFCCLGQTWSKRWGVTRNPWNLRYTCGGSSGGTAAALAAGLGPIGTGSDMAGSIRIPSSLQGLYGFKPPFGRLPCGAAQELLTFAVEGPMARTFDDLVLMQNVLVGPHPVSHSTVPAQPLPATYGDLSGWKIAYDFTLGSPAVCPDVRANMARALDGLRARGAVVEEVDLRWDLDKLNNTLLDAIFGVGMAEMLAGLPDDAYPKLTSYIQMVWDRHRNKPNSVAAAADLGNRLNRDMHAKVWSQGYQAFICPTTFTTQVRADLDPATDPTVDIDGVAIDSNLGWVATPLYNLLSRYPVLTVPTGRAASGVPTGMQIAAQPYQDEVVFQVGYNHALADNQHLYRTVFPDYRDTE